MKTCRRCIRQLAPLEGGWPMDGCCVDCFDPNDRKQS